METPQRPVKAIGWWKCVFLFVLSSQRTAEAAQGSCHGGVVKSEAAGCSVVTIPSDFCSSCRIGAYNLTEGDYLDCTRTYDLEDSNGMCLGAMDRYVALNQCDGTRRRFLDRYRADRSDDFARKVLDYFVYSICENTCDCIPQASVAVRDTPSIDIFRGNCQAHTQIDVCRVLPQIRLIRSEGSIDDSERLPKACPLLKDWIMSPAAKLWVKNPNTTVHEDLQYFLNRLMDAGKILEDLRIYQECFDMEATQTKITPAVIPIDPIVTVNPTFAPNTPIPTFPPTFAPTVSPTPLISADADLVAIYRINAGSTKVTTAPNGDVWEADKFFAGGKESAKNIPIDNTTSDFIYQTERWGSFSYNIPVESKGPFRVILHFAEIFPGNQASMERIFHVNVEDQVMMDNLDIHRIVGGYAPLTRSADVRVEDGSLSLNFIKGPVDQPKVSGIEVWAVVPKIVVTDFMLVNADTGEDLAILADGATVLLSIYPTSNLSVRALTTPEVQSVDYRIHLPIDHDGNTIPPLGIPAADKRGAYFHIGVNTISAVPYPQPNGGGSPGPTLTMSFVLSDA